MDQLSNDPKNRKELLKHMIIQLHQGEAPDEVRSRLVNLLQNIPYNEVVQVEQELINEGHKTAYLWVFEINEKAIRLYERLGGIQKEQSMKNVFGYDVLSRKIEWDDLSKIYGNQ